MDDWRVQRYLPETATDITLEKKAMGFSAKYRITDTELAAYLDDCWSKYGDRSVHKRGEWSTMSEVPNEYFDFRYGDLGWPALDKATEHDSPTAANGAGFSVWHSPSEGMAYEHAGYW